MATNYYSWLFDIFCARYFENVSVGFGSCNTHALFTVIILIIKHFLNTVRGGGGSLASKHRDPQSIEFVLTEVNSCFEYEHDTRNIVSCRTVKDLVSNISQAWQIFALQWHHNGHDGVSNHQPHGCLLNRLFGRRSKENIKAPRHWPLCGEFTGDRWIPRTNGQ